jgi:hypothetical protein
MRRHPYPFTIRQTGARISVPYSSKEARDLSSIDHRLGESSLLVIPETRISKAGPARE